MLSDAFIENFERDIARLREEISLYKDTAHLWKIPKGVNNSAGTLALHLIGNLNQWIGNVLGQSGYVRDRDSEFIIRDVPREQILSSIDDTLAAVRKGLAGLKDSDFEKIYPSDILEKDVNTVHFLIYLVSHLNYHVGQINYHRRLTE